MQYIYVARPAAERGGQKEIEMRSIIRKIAIWMVQWFRKSVDLKKETWVEIAVGCAQPALGVFEKKYPGDKRPRQAIEAAKGWLTQPSAALAAYDAASDAAEAAATVANVAASAAEAASDAASDAADVAEKIRILTPWAEVREKLERRLK